MNPSDKIAYRKWHRNVSKGPVFLWLTTHEKILEVLGLFDAFQTRVFLAED